MILKILKWLWYLKIIFKIILTIKIMKAVALKLPLLEQNEYFEVEKNLLYNLVD